MSAPYCAGCGTDAYIITSGFCADCWMIGWPTIRCCPSCGHDVAALVDESTAIRVRMMSYDVAGSTVVKDTITRLNVAAARRRAGWSS